jgi:LacI family repressor for deo operon, udp, cdd, tsx, nupC, and nupG
MNRQQAPIPKYWKLAEHFRRQMENGVLQPGDRLPSLAEMRALHGVSRPTMEKVHSILEGDGLIERLPGSGTFVLEPPKRARSGLVGISGFGFQFSGFSTYWSMLLDGVREVASKAQVQILLLDIDSTAGWEKADGILICDWSNFETLRHVPPLVPCVSMMVPVSHMASVAADDQGAARAMTQHLIELGHKRIAYLHSTDHTVTLRRLQGYRAALRDAGIEPLKKWTRKLSGPNDYGEHFVHKGHDIMATWLREDWRQAGCTAIVAHNDETAIGVMQALSEAGWKVPEEVSVAGFDGLPLSRYVAPQLTTVELPLRQIGAAAAAMLLRQINQEEVTTRHEIMPASLRVRASTAAPSRR